MSRQFLAMVIVAAACGGLFAFAFAAAPRSCDWGLTDYMWSGVAVDLILLVLPFALQLSSALWKRALLSLGLGMLGIAVWVLGFVVADVNIICRLF